MGLGGGRVIGVQARNGPRTFGYRGTFHGYDTVMSLDTQVSQSIDRSARFAGASCGDTPFDVAIIGGGIVGLATAYHLTQHYPNRRVVVLEKEAELAFHQTGRNSG